MITSIGDVMKRCYDRGWLTTRDGNASLRRCKKDYIHVTPSGARKNVIRVEDIIRLDISEQGLVIPEGSNPSGELHMHWRLLERSTTTRAVLHVHATHVVAAIYRGFDLQKIAAQFPEINRYTRVGPSVPALPATSNELGDATAACLGVSQDGTLQYDIVGQANHGVCSVAKTPWDAYEHVERLDHICEIVLKSGVSPEDI